MFGRIQSPDLLQRVVVTHFLQHATAAELRAMLAPECRSYFSFAFVRNPWDRMLSVFCRQDPHMVMSASERGIDLSRLSFDEFVDLAGSVTHVHLMPQVGFVRDEHGNNLVDFIGRFEHLEEDFARIASRLRIEARLEWHNRSVHGDYRYYYSDRSRQQVADLYRDDIEAFSYRF